MDRKIKTVLNFIFLNEIDTIFKINGFELLTFEPVQLDSGVYNIPSLTPEFNQIAKQSHVLNQIQDYLDELKNEDSPKFQRIVSALKSELDCSHQNLNRKLLHTVLITNMKVGGLFDYKLYWNKLVSFFYLNQFDIQKLHDFNLLILIDNYKVFVKHVQNMFNVSKEKRYSFIIMIFSFLVLLFLFILCIIAKKNFNMFDFETRQEDIDLF